MRNNKFYYKINEVANILDVSPATIRNWEKSKLFIARRNKSNYRQYDSTDLELLKKIKYLSIEKNEHRCYKKIVTTRYYHLNF
ncbi:MerR family transcriptional regulator [Vagococcus fluvialis]|jgi:DNA-binding transcriptional MerR regulator|uniref:MerR family transcriptional regulator n=1 Tax=Vagococcus fluvialis TaxID=2738 RepID=UPI001A8EA283|nr:MerR family transcriptional regulator [Vagococcus fluvialis]MBO0428787.1 MerR family transcriptional regulator [Vagococcus fluvialis]